MRVSATRGPRLHIRPLSFAAARAFVERHHRHHGAPQGHKFSLGVHNEAGDLVGVAIVGRPVARHFDDGLCVEVTRVAVLDGASNACSALYAAAWRTARAAGYRRALTYTQAGESGASLRGAGWRKVAERPARPGWDAPSRPRGALGTEYMARILWEIATHNAPALPAPRQEASLRRSARRCPECGAPLPAARQGTPQAAAAQHSDGAPSRQTA
jgi:hypothetical protein